MQRPEPFHSVNGYTSVTKEAPLEVGLCDPCHVLASCRPRTEPHATLQFLDSAAAHSNPILAREAGGRIDKYRCMVCGTKWHHRVDRHDVGRGFRLAPG